MGFDYRFTWIMPTETSDGHTVDVECASSYQKLIRTLELSDVMHSGQPMTAGGTTQALALQTRLQAIDGVDDVQVHFNGSRIF